MPNAWVAVDAAGDTLAWARLLRRAYDRTLSGSAPPGILRQVVVDSWRRSLEAGVNCGGLAPIMLDRDEVDQRLAQHPLSALLPVIQTTLFGVATYARQLVAVTDAEGMVLWTGGNPDILEAARRAHLVPGVLWSEEAAGTNAMGTALVLDHPVQIFSAEHFQKSMHGWSSAAAPIHDPDTGAPVGTVDLSGSFKAAHPHGFSLVAAAAQTAEAHLAHHAAQRDERLKVEYLEWVIQGGSHPSAVVNPAGRVLLANPSGWLGERLELSDDGVPLVPAGACAALELMGSGPGFLVADAQSRRRASRPVLRLQALGRERASVCLAALQLELTPRHSEILVILALHPEGVTDEQLGAELYGATTKSVTIRAELSRLRKLLGPVIQTRPYRLAAEVRADFLEVERLLSDGSVERARERYAGLLLPSSKAPAIVGARRRLDAALRRALAAKIYTALPPGGG